MTVITNPHFTEVVQGIEDEVARSGYGLLLGDSHDDPERELRLLHDLHQRRVDGVILAPSEDAKLAFRYLRQQSIPTVLVDRMANPEFD
jgi:LacI family transcriptional regulator